MGYEGYFLTILSVLFLISCSPKGENSSPTSSVPGIISACNRTSPLATGPTEKAYCSNVQTYSGVTISGTAQYESRIIAGGDSGLLGADTPKPIRYAEVTVTDSSGNIIQCGETDSNGLFSLDLPSSSSNLTVTILSRGNNSQINASVMMCPEENKPYELSAPFTADITKSIGSLTATISDEILGGAFNIFDQLVNANTYLTSKTGSCTSTYSNCTNFNPNTHKIEVFWEKGFNPGAYSGSSSGTSYYIPGSGRLFILGGVNGDVNSSDTDHFDNSVILHEYAHFLEDKFSISDSPGGSHQGNGLIDARLAWSEGFANFFQAAVLGSPLYIDTTGNIDGITSSFAIDLENQGAGGGPGVSPLDVPSNRMGEGNFREFSVTRLLMDSVDDTSSEENVTGRFEEIWATITGSDGLKYSPHKFRSVGLLHEARDTITGNSDWSPLRTIEKHQGDRTQYAQYLHANASCSSQTFTLNPELISGKDNLILNHAFETSHLLVNNDFYHYNHPGGEFKITLNYTSASTPEADLDLFIYKDEARFGNYDYIINTMTSNEGVTEPDGVIGTSENETVYEASLPAGSYLINVFNYTETGSTSTITYSLTINKDLAGELRLCPGTL